MSPIFKVFPKNLLIEGVEGIFPENINENNRAIRRMLIWLCIREKIRVNLERIEVKTCDVQEN